MPSVFVDIFMRSYFTKMARIRIWLLYFEKIWRISAVGISRNGN